LSPSLATWRDVPQHTRERADVTDDAPDSATDGAAELRRESPVRTGAPLTDPLIVQAPLGVALYDAAGRVALGNAAYERHFGVRVAEVPADYSLFTDTDRAVNFVSATGTGSGAAQANTIYGRVPSGQTSVPTGSYTDSVTISLTY
jgi:hypothetical protein